MASAKDKSRSGYYLIRLNASWEHEGFLYRPSFADITVDETVLAAAVEAGVVESQAPAD